MDVKSILKNGATQTIGNIEKAIIEITDENRREWKIAIDWEYYLDAEGDELQDAYDLAVEEAEEMLGWDEEWDND